MKQMSLNLMNHNLVLYVVEEQTWHSTWHMMWQPTVTVVDPLSSCVGWMPKEPLTVFHILFSSKKPWGPCLTAAGDSSTYGTLN